MALLHSTVHTSQSEANTSLVTSRKKDHTKEKEIHITVYTSDEDSLASGQEVKNGQKEKKEAVGSTTTMASNDKPTQFKVGEGCFAKVIHILGS